MMTRQERDDVAAMVRGMSPLPKAASLVILTLIMAGLFFAVYAIVSAVRGEAFVDFANKSVLGSMLIVLGISFLVRHRLDRLTLRITRQYNQATLARGRLKVELSVIERLKQFIPTLVSWKGLLLLWVIANALDCFSTYLGLHYGAQEANPAARSAANMYLSKWIGVLILTAIVGFFQWKQALSFLTTLMFLVVLSNFAVMGMHLVQSNLADVKYPDIGMPAFSIQLVETMVIAAVILWGKEIWNKLSVFYRQRIRRQNAVH